MNIFGSSRHGLTSALRVKEAAMISAVRFESTALNLANLKRGKGGRSSFNGNVVTVFGATSRLGFGVISKLAKIGCQVIVTYRGSEDLVEPIKVAGDLGQILFVPIQLKDEYSIAKALRYSNMAVNLIQAHWPTRNYKMHDVNVTGAANIARIARESGVESYLHLSSMNVSYNPPKFYFKGSEYLRTKAYGEDAVREAFPDCIMFRPSDVFGNADRFLHYYSNFWRRSYNPLPGTNRRRVPLWKYGVYTTKMPVFMDDVTRAISLALRNPEARGKTYDIHGPHRYRLDDLIVYIYELLRDPDPIIHPLTPMFFLKAWVLQTFPAQQTRLWLDKLETEFISDTTTGLPTMADLGMNQLTTLEERCDYEIAMFRRRGYYWEMDGEFAGATPPPTIDKPKIRPISKILADSRPGYHPEFGATLEFPKLAV